MTRQPQPRSCVGPILFVSIVLFYLLLKLYALHPVVGDENIYFYYAWRTSEGAMPYRDFPFAHPPFHIYVMAVIAWISDSSFTMLKLAPALMTLGSALCLFSVAGDRQWRFWFTSRAWPLLSVAIFLFSFDTLRISSHCTGVNQATFLMMLGLLLFLRQRPIAAGFCYAASFATATYMLPLLVFLILFAWPRDSLRRFSSWRLMAQVVLSMAFSFLLIHLPVWITAPGEWWRQAVIFHLKKPSIGPAFGNTVEQLMAAEGCQIVACAIVSAIFLFKRPATRLIWLPLTGLAYIACLGLLKRVYIYYLFPAFPLLALGTVVFLKLAWAEFKQKGGVGRRLVAIVLIATAVAQPCFYVRLASRSRQLRSKTTYVFHPTPCIGQLNSVISLIFPRSRYDCLPAPGVFRYLWHENRFWYDATELAAQIDEYLRADETLYGDSTTTPLLAFLARRRIACDLADTNTLQFRTGLRSISGDIARAREDNVRLLVAQTRHGIYLLLPSLSTSANLKVPLPSKFVPPTRIRPW